MKWDKIINTVSLELFILSFFIKKSFDWKRTSLLELLTFKASSRCAFLRKAAFQIAID